MDTMTTEFSLDQLDDFTHAYITCALWSSTDDEGEPLDTGRDESDIHPATLALMVQDCKLFQQRYGGALQAAYARTHRTRNGEEDYTPAQAGHDFWLTRNGHGAGFWDRGLESLGEYLTNACGWRTAFPGVDLYLGDDQKIHQQ